jgi:hypothetical protein
MALNRSTSVMVAAVGAATLMAAFGGNLLGPAALAQAPAPPAQAPGGLPTGRGGLPLYDSALDFSLTDACGGRSKTPMEACENDVNRMTAARAAFSSSERHAGSSTRRFPWPHGWSRRWARRRARGRPT